ncbi:MAG: type IV pilus assembly protein PilM, partial [Elusimicrobia bacterium]|nr:type IV pilus assembly protein PilM [Elusimicrobiota bacterium]
GKKDVIGVDLGTSNVKILELKVSGGKITVANFARLDISSYDIMHRAPEERRQVYTDILKQLLGKCKFSTKNAAVSISGSSVIVRCVKFPKMTPADLQKALQFEAEPHIPFDIQEVDMDTYIIGDVEEEGQTKMETVLVASKKDTIGEKVDIVEMAGLRPAIIDVDAFALENAYGLMHKDLESKMMLLINIGANTTTISIVDKGVSKVVRDLYAAGSNLTKAIQNNMQIPIDKAEELKMRYGIKGEEDDVGPQIKDILYPTVKELNSEIQRSIDYFTGQQTGREINIEKIVLAGGGAKLKGLGEFINSELNIPVEVFYPLENASVSAKNADIDLSDPALAVVTGLALRKIGDHKAK